MKTRKRTDAGSWVWNRLFCVLSLLCFRTVVPEAQPVIPKKMDVEGLTIYPDLRDTRLFYYAPGILRLALEKDDKPRFQLVEMRYTGTGAAGDQGAKQFLNLVQVQIWMAQPEGAQLKSAQQQLGGNKISLKPMPLRNVEACLIMPVGMSDGRYRKIGQSAGLEGGEGKDGGFWTERTFTVRLDNAEAQLLWDQVANGRLAMSIGWAYYADVIMDTEAQFSVSGDSEAAADLSEQIEDVLRLDSTETTRSFMSGAFPIEIDVKRWPELLKKIDINDEAPPAWAVLELRCYDFANELRPDLAMKVVEFEAVGVNEVPVKVGGKKFMRAKPDLNTLQIRFPYAVKLTQPYKYRIVEYTESGQRKEMPWQWRTNWAEVLDVTTPPSANQLEMHEIEIEIDREDFESAGATDLSVQFLFSQKGVQKRMPLNWEKGDTAPVKVLRFYSDKDQPVQYYAKWKQDGAMKKSLERTIGTDEYVYLKFGE